MKKILSVLLAAALLISALPVTAFAAEAAQGVGNGEIGGETGSCTWSFDNDSGVLTLSGSGSTDNYGVSGAPWSAYSGDIISLTVENGVTGIGTYAFDNCAQLASIALPSSLTSVGAYAFYDCALESVAIPSGVGTIGDYAFGYITDLEQINGFTIYGVANSGAQLYADDHSFAFNPGTSGITGSDAWIYDNNTLTIRGCGATADYSSNDQPWYSLRYNITSVVIESGVTKLGASCFECCINLTSAFIPKSLKTAYENYYYGSFKGCSKLAVVTFEAGTTEVAPYLFAGCTGLAGGITLPNGITRIGNRAFYECQNMRSVVFPSSLESIGDYAFYKCSLLGAVELPSSVTSIGDWAFYYCTLLAVLSLNDSLESIGQSAFNHCTSLSGYLTLPTSLERTGIGAFESCTSLTGAFIPKSLFDAGGNSNSGLFTYCSSLTTIDFEQGITVIPDSIFVKCTGLHELVIPSTVTTIENDAFNQCSNLTDITIPNSVQSIGSYAFSSCTSLESISIPSSVTTIGYCTFQGCTSLTDIGLPGSIEEIGVSAFANCTSLTSFTVPANVTKIDIQAFHNCTSLTQINFNQSLTRIGNHAFYNCTSLAAAIFPESLKYLESNCFENCVSLATVHIPKSICEGFANDPFVGCTALKNITFGEGITKIPDNIFKNCTGLETVVIPNTVTQIGNSSFSGCTSLSSLTLSSSLQKLSSFSFGNCTSLASVEIPKSLSNADPYRYGPFSDCSGLKTVTFESGVTEIVPFLFAGCDGIESISIPNGVTKIGQYAFYNTSLKSIDLPDTVTTIEGSAFGDCAGLEAVIGRANDITSIQNDSFSNDNNVIFYGLHAATNFKSTARNVFHRPYICIDGQYTPSWAWVGCEAATLTLSCADCGGADPVSFEAEITSEVTIPETCTEEGLRTYTATVELPYGATYTDTKTEAIPPKGHSYNDPVWTWDGFDSASASFTCVEGDDVQTVQAEITFETITDAQCLADGTRVYTATVTFMGETYTNTKAGAVSATGHSYGAPTSWTWNTGNGEYTGALANFTCQSCGHNESLTANVYKEITASPTCTENGEYTYTASVTSEGLTYTDTRTKSFPANGHSLTNEWNWEGCTAATLTLRCTECDFEETLTAEITLDETIDPQCLEDGHKTWCATVEYNGVTYTDTKNEPLSATGHSMSLSEWTWDGYSSATATFICSACGFVETVDAVITSQIKNSPTLTTDGVRTYHAVAEYNGETYDSYKDEVIPAEAHSFGEPTWQWHGITSARATFACSHCNEKRVIDAQITMGYLVEPTCTEGGIALATAKVTFNGVEYTSVRGRRVSALGHNYVVSDLRQSGTLKGTVTLVCSRCGDVKEQSFFVPRPGATISGSNCNPGFSFTQEPKFTGDVIRIKGGAQLIIYLALSEEQVSSGASVSFNIADKHIDNAEMLTDENAGISYAICPVDPDELNSELTATVRLNGQSTSYTCSPSAYINCVMNDNSFRSYYSAEYGDLEYDQLAARAAIVSGSESYIPGDVNNDGEVDIRDATDIQRCLAEMTELSGVAFMAADTNGDNEITIEDVTLLQMYLAQFEVELG